MGFDIRDYFDGGTVATFIIMLIGVIILSCLCICICKMGKLRSRNDNKKKKKEKYLDRALRERKERTTVKHVPKPYVCPETDTIKPATDVPQVTDFRSAEANPAGKSVTLYTDIDTTGRQVSTQTPSSTKSLSKDLTLELSKDPYYGVPKYHQNNKQQIINHQDSYSPESQSSTYNLLPTTQIPSIYPSSKIRIMSQPIAPRVLSRQTTVQEKYSTQQPEPSERRRPYRQSSLYEVRGSPYSPSEIAYHRGSRESSSYHDRRPSNIQKSYHYDAMNDDNFQNTPDYQNYGGFRYWHS